MQLITYIKSSFLKKRYTSSILLLKVCLLSIALIQLTDNCYAYELRHSYAIFSEPKYSKDFKHFDYVNPDAPKGGSFVKGHVGAMDSLNAYTLKGNKAPGLEYIYDTLLVSSFDELSSFYPLLAESFYVSPKNDWVVFNIRKEARWHDDTPITSEDVAFSVNILREKGSPTYQIMLKEVGAVDILDEHTVKIHMLNTRDPALIAVIGQLPILSSAYFKQHDFLDSDDVPMLTSGPYRIKEYKPNKTIVYERVNDYWGKELPVNKGYYNFEYLKYEAFLENIIAIEALKGGELDFREENVSKLWAKAYNSKAIKDGRLKKEFAIHTSPPNLQSIFLNTRRPLLHDIHLRKALTECFDFDWMNKYLFHGLYKRIESYYQNTQYSAPGLPSAEEISVLSQFRDQLPNELFTKEFTIPSTDADPLKNRANLVKAKKMLLDAGYYYSGTKLMSSAHKPVEMDIIYHFQGFERIFLAYKENLEKIGIKLNLRLLDYTQYQKRLQDFDFDMTVAALAPAIVPGDLELQLWHSSSDVVGGLNFAGIHDNVVDYLIEKLRASDTKEQKVLYARCLDRVLLWNYYSVLQLYSNNYRLIYWDKFGIPDVRPTYYLGLETWWLKN
ncbi:MAG: extracellular solute-binding protein [Candidatus Jidaibacter sp.]|nr:extracellular solute-binding protein [Candidatus Jidaibacter sp.]